MSILDLVSTCGSTGLANLISIAKKALSLIQMAGPIIAIVALVIILIKLMSNPDNKKLKGAFKNWLIGLVMIFFVPLIINAIMGFLDDSFTIAACWNYADNVKPSTESSYISPSDENSQSIVGNPSDYDEGEERKKGTSGKNNTTSNSTSNNTQTTVNKFIFIGDSRTVGMQNAVGSNDVWSAKEGSGLSWMKSTGVPQIENSITNGSAVIILMGVNDLYKIDSYISYINSKVNNWSKKGAKIYFVSVLPTDGEYNSLNSEIESFNSKIRSSLSGSVKFIDTNSYLKSSGFTTVDGLHYNNDTYKKIYNHIKSNV